MHAWLLHHLQLWERKGKNYSLGFRSSETDPPGVISVSCSGGGGDGVNSGFRGGNAFSVTVIGVTLPSGFHRINSSNSSPLGMCMSVISSWWWRWWPRFEELGRWRVAFACKWECPWTSLSFLWFLEKSQRTPLPYTVFYHSPSQDSDPCLKFSQEFFYYVKLCTYALIKMLS